MKIQRWLGFSLASLVLLALAAGSGAAANGTGSGAVPGVKVPPNLSPEVLQAMGLSGASGTPAGTSTSSAGQSGQSPQPGQYGQPGQPGQPGPSGQAPPFGPPPPLPYVADPFTQPLPVFGRSLFYNAAGESLPVQLGPVPPNYVLGIGDVIRVQLWTGQVQQVNVDLTADQQGNIALDDVGSIPVAGMSLAAFRSLLQQRYAKLYQGFTLTVTVPQMRTVDIFVIGEVNRPGKYTLPGNATLFTALFVAGGPTDAGSLRSLRLTHADNSVLNVDLYDYLLSGLRVADVPLQPGDSLFVPLLGPVVDVAGQVRRPARYEMKTPLTVPAVLAMAGGLLPQAFATRVQVRRYAANQTFQTWDLNLASGEAAQAFLLQDGDRVVAEPVVAELSNAVTLEGSVYRPGTYELTPGLTLGALLRAAEGLNPNAYGDWGLLRRLDPATGVYSALSIAPLPAQNGVAGLDLPLRARDMVTIYSRDTVLGQLTVSVLGQVRTPGPVLFLPGMTVRDALLQAGGLLPGAFADQASLVRVQPDMRRQVLAVNLARALAASPADNVVLQAHDELTVRALSDVGAPQMVSIRGRVKTPGDYPRYEGMKVSDLLAAAGGLVPGATSLAQVTHGRYTSAPLMETVKLDPNQPLGVVTPDLPLRDDDLVAVMSEGGFIQRPCAVLVLGQVTHPGPYVIPQPTSHPQGVWDLLSRAGGPTPDAYGPGIVVYRQTDSLMTDDQQAEFQRLLQLVDSQKHELRGQDFTSLVPSTTPPKGASAAPATGSSVPASTPGSSSSVATPSGLGAPPGAGLALASGTPPPAIPSLPSPGTSTPGTTPTAAAELPAESAPTSAALAAGLAQPPSTIDNDTGTAAVPGSTPDTGTTAGLPTPAPAVVRQATQVLTKSLAGAYSDSRGNLLLVIPPRDLASATFSRALPVSWKELQASAGQRGDVILGDGDVIYVPVRPGLILVAGAVQNQGAQRFTEGLTVGMAVQRAGGLGPDAEPNRLLIIRLNGEIVPVTRRATRLEPGDAVIVPTGYIVHNIHSASGIERLLSFMASTVAGFRFLF